MEFTTPIYFLIRRYERGELARELAVEKLIHLEKCDRYSSSSSIIEYTKGKLSPSKLSQQLEESISEVMEKFSDLGVQSPLEKNEFKEGYGA